MFTNKVENCEPILHEIGCLEGSGTAQSGTKPEKPLTGVLGGLMHKHYVEAGSIRSMVLNIRNHWRKGKLDEEMASAWKPGTTMDAASMQLFVKRIIGGSYRERLEQRQITGEWIVYVRENGINYYLTLGRHGKDAEILKHIQLCAAELAQLEYFKTRYSPCVP